MDGEITKDYEQCYDITTIITIGQMGQVGQGREADQYESRP